MSTHDTLAWAVASEAVRRIRAEDADWSRVFSTSVYPTLSRAWPVPDFVIRDVGRRVTAAAEFKPPEQSKREYLTGLGQSLAYTRDFDYALLVLPTIAGDGYPIADHVRSVVEQEVAASIPLGLITYDPRTLSERSPGFIVLRPLEVRVRRPAQPVEVAGSFYAKWREASPSELARFLDYLYQEGRADEVPPGSTIRDRAFARLWTDMVAGATVNWAGERRQLTDTPANRTAQAKNYRNFPNHIGWCAPDGRLTSDGLNALHIAYQYGHDASVFIDLLARDVLLSGKHLILFNAITRFQDRPGPTYEREADWLHALETAIEEEGLLERNEGRRLAAVAGSPRGFLKAEKQLWRQLSLVVPYGPGEGRVFHPGRGFIFNWQRITSLVASRTL